LTPPPPTNIAGVGTLGYDIDLPCFSRKARFAALFYKDGSLVFGNGKVIITGVKTIKDLNDGLKIVEKKILGI
jgi:hypothetical protein